MERLRFLRRKAASKYLQEVHGVVRAPSTLAKYAVLGGGPVFQRLGRDPVYTPVSLDEWVASQLSGPMRSTSDRETFACELPVTRIDASDGGAGGARARERSAPS
jgi:hypothetical protein